MEKTYNLYNSFCECNVTVLSDSTRRPEYFKDRTYSVLRSRLLPTKQHAATMATSQPALDNIIPANASQAVYTQLVAYLTHTAFSVHAAKYSEMMASMKQRALSWLSALWG